jgi:tetratricopeptide (TPR) repeat protein
MIGKTLKSVLFTLPLGFMLVLPLAASAQSASTVTPDADALFQLHKWAEAAKAYEVLTKANPADGRAWYRMGAALLSLGEYERAAGAFQKAFEISKRAEPMYGLAAAYSMMKEKDSAFEWLTKALNAHLSQPEQIEKDPHLASLRTDPRFKAVLAIVEKLNNPCTSQPEYKQFDFWVGEWVVTSEGQQVATSSIQRIVNGCIIFENYAQSDGFTGKSFNFFDATLKKWRQTWVDGTARVSEFAGMFKDGAMRFEGESHLQDGTRILRRMTLFNLAPDRVRQLSEASTDGGKTWRVTYDFLYTRHN